MAKGQETRERIIAEAAALFNHRGFEGGSMSELMEATGLEKGGIYRHFSSKEELAAEAFDYAWRSAFETRMQDLERIPNSIDKLKRFIANFIERRPAVSGGCPLLNTAIEADDGNEVLRDRVRAALRQWRDSVSEIVDSGIKGGEIRQGVDPKEAATIIISALEGALMIVRLERKKDALLTAQSYLERYFDTELHAEGTSGS